MKHYQNLLKRKELIAFYSMIVLLFVTLSGCSKEGILTNEDIPAANAKKKENADAVFMSRYSGLPFQTLWELQQARAASAKYQNIENVIADGYVDIAVDVENMGHHYMKPGLVDEVFDLQKPEILVYNKDEKGRQRLVAVEYAIHISEPKPEGFTGSHDVWDGSSPFPFWLLHAWVWEYNPVGVFNPTNPMVHLH
jgi:hypothetical protein